MGCACVGFVWLGLFVVREYLFLKTKNKKRESPESSQQMQCGCVRFWVVKDFVFACFFAWMVFFGVW